MICTNQLTFIRNIVAKRGLASLVCGNGIDGGGVVDGSGAYGVDGLGIESLID
ncbi:MAG: hypothetical protein WAQ98_19535 [Blastocatellia bacterium]